ncbi:MAG: cytochrome c biogenesis protein CcsA [Bacteroidales bacterium]|nr:cytochrome c biogenesis protein CcsA [Bacteroidales bacterium]
MKNIYRFLISMPFMGFLILTLAFSSAAATFIENDYGASVARAVVYNSWWFELLLILIMINLVGNMIINKVYKKKKLSIFLFHFAFFIIFLGAAVTRYISYEGSMHIREGNSSDEILSSESFIYGSVESGNQQKNFSYKTHILPGRKSHFKRSVNLGQKKYKLELVKYIPNASQTLIPDPQGEAFISVVILGANGREAQFLKEGETTKIGDQQLGFNHNPDMDDFHIYKKDSKLYFLSNTPTVRINMAANSKDTLDAGQPHILLKGNLYTTPTYQMVLKDYLDKGRYDWVTSSREQSLPDALTFRISEGNTQKQITVFGKSDRLGASVSGNINEANFTLAYGPRSIQLPFSLHLKDFQLEKYPGSNSPSSYASEVILIDDLNKLEKPFRIYMNHILNYQGYKFFQSSYDTDEKGTILSVNHDSLGTMLTYIGYFLMTLGMLISIFNKNSRFMKLARTTGVSGNNLNSGLVIVLITASLFFTTTGNISAQEQGSNSHMKVIPPSQANEFASVLVQDQGGRIKPLYSLASDILRKTLRKNEYAGQDPVQIFLGMYFYPESWQNEPIIRISGEFIPGLLGIKGKYASYIDFFDMNNNNAYKLNKYVQEAYQKRPAERNKFDQDVMKVDERLNVSYMVYSGSLLKIFPAKGDPEHHWYTAQNAGSNVPLEDSLFVSGVLNLWFASVIATGQEASATEILKGVKKYQKLSGGEIIPLDSKITLEVFYEKYEIFGKLTSYYGLIGFVLLIILFIKIINQNYTWNRAVKISTLLLLLGFIIHTAGLGIRWYISGHAPWSNGYESMIYIAWAAMLSGLIFVKKTPFSLAAAAILSALTLFVAHLSWMNPEITNLVPVLKSYWLTIHVSVITASYGFLGMGMIIGLLNLLLYVMKTEKNNQRIQQQLEVLTNVSEMALILGVYFISIGTFLGGIWANESWGRYWGWDPKETWALVTGLVYIFVVHMRMIPGLRGYFAFNLASVLAFFSVLMTYFGVNYYLAGLHSYAQGDPVPIPTFVYYMLVSLTVLILFAWFNERKYAKGKSEVGSQKSE